VINKKSYWSLNLFEVDFNVFTLGTKNCYSYLELLKECKVKIRYTDNKIMLKEIHIDKYKSY